MELSASAEKIISQSHQWNFAGDCEILLWMQEISKNLCERAQSTSDALQKLNVNVNRTSITLDNASNSLKALQYSQFVESRVQDDDDETNVTAGIGLVPEEKTTSDEEPTKSSNEILKTFLAKNLEMLHNCHEKYALDFEDSDEEDSANNCIYQPKNPYNDRLLPHIYGTKLWKENWHVGLCDGANDYSGDEISEAFSDSTNSAEDNESYESKSANLSEWASSTSILNEKYPTNIAVQNASSLRGSQTLFPGDQNIQRTRPAPPFAEGSDTSSTSTSRTASNRRPDMEHDLFASLQNTPPTSASSSAATPPHQHHNIPATTTAGIQYSQGFAKSTTVPFFDDCIPEDDIFTRTEQNTNAYMPTKPVVNQIKRKPVNLFDDDDFNSFMTEIVDKANAKEEAAPTPAARKLSSTSASTTIKTQPQAFKRETRKSVDLFASRGNSPVDEEQPMLTPKMPESIVIEKPTDIPRNQPLNLFDSPDASPTNEPLFPVVVTANKNTENIIVRTKITAKSLFDDDDDDDDFLNVFGTKKINIKTPVGKTLLFSGDTDEEDNAPKAASASKSSQHLDSVRNVDMFGEVSEAIKTSEKKTPDLFDDSKLKHSSLNVQKASDIFAEENPPKNDGEIIAVDNAKKAAESISARNIFADETIKQTNHEKPSKADLFATDLFGPAKNDNLEEKLFEKPQKAEQKTNQELFLEIPIDKDDLFSTGKTEMASSDEPPFIQESADELNSKNESNSHNLFTTDSSNETTTPEMETNSVSETDNVSSSIESPPVTTSTANTTQESSSERKSSISSLESSSASNKWPASAEESINKPPPSSAYVGIFLDEPPDDDFFQTLNSNHLSTSKFPLDLENDFYEPALPQPPPPPTQAALQKDDTKLDAPPNISDYGGLCLFSDVPPPDDDDNDGENVENVGTVNATGSKRLHSVFYDDFNETMKAIENPLENKVPIHSLFDETPPDDFETKASTNTQTILSEDVLDHRESLTNKPQEIIYPQQEVTRQSSVKEILSRLKDDIEPSVDEKPKPGKSRESAGVSKLQIPNLNINVQALLPNSGGKPNFRKSLEEQLPPSADKTIENIISENKLCTGRDARTGNQHKNTNENILPNVCKDRVRAPAKRRPSTRRGRQENYRKSLLEEQDDFEVEQIMDATNATKTLSSAEKNVFNEQTIIHSINEDGKKPELKPAKQLTEDKPRNEIKEISKMNNSTGIKTKPDFNDLFADNEADDDEDFLFNTKPKGNVLTQKNNTERKLNSPTLENSLFASVSEVRKIVEEDKTKQNLPKTETKPIAEKQQSLPKATNKPQAAAAILSGFSDANDDLFLFDKQNDAIKNIRSTEKLLPSKETKPSTDAKAGKSIAPKLKQENSKSLFGDEESNSDDDLFKSGATLKNSKAKSVEQPHRIAPRKIVSKKIDSLFDSEGDEDHKDDVFSRASKRTQKSNIEVKHIKSIFSDSENDDDDDLFGSGKKTVKVTTTLKQRQMKDPLSTQQLGAAGASGKSTSATTSTLADNPLADLLNS